MNAVARARAMLMDPAAEWPRIEQESGDPAFLLSRYVAPLALIPALVGFVGSSVIGAVSPEAIVLRTPVLDGLFGAILGYAGAFVTLLLLALIINGLAPLFGGQRNFGNALKLAVYSCTPVWLAGIFLVLPGLRFLVLTGFYGVYVLATGMPHLMKASTQRTPLYVLIVAICACAFFYAVTVAQRTMFGTPGL